MDLHNIGKLINEKRLNMTTKLNVNFLYTQIENNIITVGFADDEFNTQEYILLQKTIIYDDQDKKLGFNRIHITCNDQSRSAYGGILKFIFNNGKINILLDPNTADVLKTEDQIEIVFPTNTFDLAKLRQYLQELFSEESEVLVSEV